MRDALSKKIVDIEPSGIRKFFDIVSEMPDAISLGVGEPDFDTPYRVREEGIYSLEKGRTFYTSNAGLKELRDEISRYIARKYNLNYGKLIATCKVENIPFPSSGYWTKKNMGKDVSNEIVEFSGLEDTEISLITKDAVVKRIRKAKAEVVEKVHTDVTEIRLVKELVNKAEDYRIAKEIREYIQAMIDSENEDITPEWIEWALKKADWYDPSIATEDEYLGKRQHEKSAEEKEKSLQDSIRKSWYW